MTPLIHCVRHGQGLHNLDGGNYLLPDPSMTSKGVSQCETCRDVSFPDQSDVSLVMASPLCRALHSATVIFGPALTSGGKCPPHILAVASAQETSDDPCDIGRNPDLLRSVAAENQWPVDLSFVENGWNVKALDSRYSPASHAIEARAKDTRILIRQKIRELVAGGDDDVHVILVSHGAFLHFLANDWEGADTGNGGTGWKNCETRSYQFVHHFDTDVDQDAMLVETTESRKMRGKDHPMFGQEMQQKLFVVAMEAWGSHGLQRPDQIGKK